MKSTAAKLFVLGAIALSLFGQSTTVTFSDGGPCSNGPNPSFTTTALDYKVTLILPSGGAGNPLPTWSLSDIMLGKRADLCSVVLYRLLFSATNVRSVVISHRSAANVEQLRITLSNVHVSAAEQTLQGDALALSFTKIEISTPTGGSTACFDRTTGGTGSAC